MKQKILLPLLGSLLSLPAMAQMVHDFEYTYEGQTLTYRVIDEEAKTCETQRGYYYVVSGEIEAGNNVSGALIIPEKVNDGYSDYTVTSIGNDTFYGCGDLTSVEIPNSVTSIGEFAFYECTGLTSVVIPNSVTYIGRSAFYGCSSLTSIEIPNLMTYIDEATFKYCSGLTSVEIPNPVIFIGSNAFEGCSGLTSVEIPNSVIFIADGAFSMCSSLTSVVIPNSVGTISERAFAGDSKLESIIMGHNVKTIREKAFDGCPANTVSITAQTPPTAPNNTFSNYSGKLYLQGEETRDIYNAYTCWDRFSSYVMIDAEKINIDGADKISGKPGDTFQLTASIWPENVTLPQIFWRSTNPEIATVDANGLVTLHADLEEVLTRAQGDADIDGTCTIIAETLYNDGPVAQVTVSNTGIDAVDSVTADGEGSIDYTRPYEVYNMSGLKVADSTEGLTNGLYIIRQGNAAVKTVIR